MGVQLHRTGAVFDPELTYREWFGIGRQLEAVEACFQWVLGDWLNFGEHSYGEKYKQGIEATGLSEKTLTNVAYVANAIQFSRRRDMLTWSHHSEVAPFEPTEQDEWLTKAEAEKWSVMDMRQAIRKAKSTYGDEEHGKPVRTFIGWVSEGVRLLNRRMQDKPIDQWPANERATMRQELKPIVDLYEKL